MKNLSFFTFLIILLISSTLEAQANQNAQHILKDIRLGAVLQHINLNGHMRKENGEIIPLSLTLKGKEITFQFYKNKKWIGFGMLLDHGKARLFETSAGRARPMPIKKIVQPILGSNVTYEDLSLQFLYWNDANILGEEKIKLQNCYKIRLNNPGSHGRYQTVMIWVHKKAKALMQVAGYSAQNKLLKKFHITELMKVDNVQTIKKMNIESYQPGTNNVIGVTKLEFSRDKSSLGRRRRGL